VVWPVSYKPNAGRMKRIAAKLPSTVIVLAVSAAVVSAFHLPVETIGSRFGPLPSGLPMPAMPEFNWETAQNLVGPTIAIALLGAIESLLCARVADGLIGDRHDPNQELMAQGVANFIAPFFGGIAVTGTIARTVTNVRTGGRTPIAGIVHALALFLVILVAAPLASKIPLAALAAILMWVAWNMGEWREFVRIRQFSMIYKATLLSTFFLTVVFDLVVAVEVGLVLSSLFFIYRMSSLTKIEPIDLPHPVARLADGRRVEAYALFGSFFFGSVTKLENLVNPKGPVPDVLVLEMHQVINMDTTGLDALEGLHAMLKKRGSRLVLVDPNEQPLGLFRRSGFIESLGHENIFESMEEVIDHFLDVPREDEGPGNLGYL
jgi:SulP family sulfate permease